MFEQVEGLLREHADLQEQLADPALHADAARAKKVNRRYAELNKIKAAHEQWQQLGDDLEAARELAKRTRRSPRRSRISRWRSPRLRRRCGAC